MDGRPPCLSALGPARAARSASAVASALAMTVTAASLGCTPLDRAPPRRAETRSAAPLTAPAPSPQREAGVERLHGQFVIAGIVAGYLSIDVHWCEGSDGEVTVESHAKSSELVSLVRSSRGMLRSQIETSSLFPLRHEAKIWRSNGVIEREGVFAPGLYQRVSSIPEEPLQTIRAPISGKGRAHDLHSSLLLVRRWQGRRGERAPSLGRCIQTSSWLRRRCITWVSEKKARSSKLTVPRCLKIFWKVNSSVT